MKVRRPHSPPVAFLAWTSRPGRAAEIADVFGGRAVVVYPQWAAAFTPLRYVVSFVLSLAKLAWMKPNSVIATNPPALCGLAGFIYAVLFRIPFVMDAHPVAFGAKNNKVGRLMLPLTKLLARQARLTLVTTDDWVREVEKWGGEACELHEAPPDWPHQQPDAVVPGGSEGGSGSILYVGIFGGDEPVEEVVQAARLVPEFRVVITGDTARAPRGLVESAPGNVTFSGYLNFADYTRAMASADVISSFTTEPTSVMRAAYEAVYALKPLVITDTPGSDRLFPYAVRVVNDAESIAGGWTEAVNRLEELRNAAPDGLAVQQERWRGQRDRLQLALTS